MTKQEIRKYVLTNRKSFSLEYDKHYRLFVNLFKDKKIVGLFYPLEGEINLLDLITWFKEITFVFPKTKEEISFHYVDEKGFKKGLFNVFEPQGCLVEKQLIDLIIVPALAINSKGFRVGYGKGYYDRYLKDYKKKTVSIIQDKYLLEFEESSFDIKISEVILV